LNGGDEEKWGRRRPRRGLGGSALKDFGDNPKIRHSHGEHTHFNPNEPWEVRYRTREEEAPAGAPRPKKRRGRKRRSRAWLR
jgi:hypothetical protein